MSGPDAECAAGGPARGRHAVLGRGCVPPPGRGGPPFCARSPALNIAYSQGATSFQESLRQVHEDLDIPPKMTVGIPTHERPGLLPRAIDSVLRQTVSCRVLIADDGDATRTASLLGDRYGPLLESGRIIHAPRPGTGLWANWDACARACKTDFFCFLQDDDVLTKYAMERAISGLEQFPDANLWMAPNKLALSEDQIYWNNGNGPWVPLNPDGRVESWESEILAPTCYFVSWSLSPGVVFRNNAAFRAALDRMPDCPIFAERLILVFTGGRFVADPYVAGLWIQHAENHSRTLYDDQPRQTRILFGCLDRAMDALGERWRPVLETWCRLQHPNWLLGWIREFEHAEREGGPSRYGEAIREVMARSLVGRVRYVPQYRRWYRWYRKARDWFGRT